MTAIYQILIEGHLDPSWSEWLDRMVITTREEGVTCLSGPVADQAALHGILNRIRDLNLKLLSVEKKGED